MIVVNAAYIVHFNVNSVECIVHIHSRIYSVHCIFCTMYNVHMYNTDRGKYYK